MSGLHNDQKIVGFVVNRKDVATIGALSVELRIKLSWIAIAQVRVRAGGTNPSSLRDAAPRRKILTRVR